jgi:hypothetical protein
VIITCKSAAGAQAAVGAASRIPEVARLELDRKNTPSVYLLCFLSDGGGPFGGLNFTPARRAFERTMTIACCDGPNSVVSLTDVMWDKLTDLY